MLVSKIKPCMSQYKQSNGETANLRDGHACFVFEARIKAPVLFNAFFHDPKKICDADLWQREDAKISPVQTEQQGVKSASWLPGGPSFAATHGPLEGVLLESEKVYTPRILGVELAWLPYQCHKIVVDEFGDAKV